MDVNLLTGTGLKEDEIRSVLSAKDDNAKIKELRICRLRVLDEMHKKQQELDRLDYVIRKIKEVV